MSVVHAADAVVHELHGARFTSYASPARGSTELCAWRLDLPGGSTGVPHTVSREEVIFVLSGSLRVTLGPGTAEEAASSSEPGDAVVVPAGATLRVDNPGHEAASAWVATSVGLEAVLPDGSTFCPPWAR